MPQVSLEIYRDRQFLKQLFGMALYEHPYLFSYPLTHMVAPNDCDYMINQVSFKEGVFDGEFKMAILGKKAHYHYKIPLNSTPLPSQCCFPKCQPLESTPAYFNRFFNI